MLSLAGRVNPDQNKNRHNGESNFHAANVGRVTTFRK